MSDDMLKFDTPVGELEWVFISGRGKKNLKDEDVYAASVKLPTESEACQAFIKKITDFWEANKPKKAKEPTSLGFKPELDDEENETGYTVISLWTSVEWPDGRPKTIKVFNAKGAEVDLGNKKIGNGSRGRIKGLAKPYENANNKGVALYLTSLQLTKFVPFEGDGFDAVDDEDGDSFDSVDDGMGGINDPEAGGAARPQL